jgi:hypothetical protein
VKLTEHQTIKVYVGLELQLHSFLTLQPIGKGRDTVTELLGAMFSTSAKGRWTSGTARNMENKNYSDIAGAI